MPGERVVRVLPDVPAIDKTFDYLVPDTFGDQVRVGTVVRVELHGRRVGGWVVADGVEPPAGVSLRPLAKVTGWGPAPELLELADWAAWRWAGRPASLLGTATADRAVPALPRPRAPAPLVTVPAPDGLDELVAAALDGAGVDVVRLPPSVDPFPVVVAAARRGPTLALTPGLAWAGRLGARLRRAGIEAAVLPDGWAQARAGAPVVVGARAAAWAPVPGLAAAVVIDEHDEVYAEERTPTWNARDVVIERARRAGVPCLLTSPVPSLEAQRAGTLRTLPRVTERAGWPVVDVVDLRREDPTHGLLTGRLTAALRGEGRVVCVVNRKGRARLLVCRACDEIARCERCDAAVVLDDESHLVCLRCGTVRPSVCQHCGATRFKLLRMGVSRLRDDLEALAGTPVVEVTGDRAPVDVAEARVLIGTEAVLHLVRRADVVAFLDLDQELLAPRYRAAEQALALVARAARVVGGRERGGRLVLQTRLPHHDVVQAAVLADPARVAEAESSRRAELGWPPAVAMAAVSGPSAEAYIEALGAPLGVEVLGPADGRWLVRAADHQILCDALRATPRPGGRLRIEVDPLRI